MNNLLPFLPFDVIIEILLRLPVKSLLRFHSVCKNWQTLITSSSFVNHHFHHPTNSAQPLVFWIGMVLDKSYTIENRGKENYISSVTLFPNGATKSSPLRVDKGPESDFCGPCNGIICLWFYPLKFVLWNPATRKSWPIPDTHGLVNYFPPPVFSFWVDPFTNEFKFFMMTNEDSRVSLRYTFVTYSSIDSTWTETRVPFAVGDECAFNYHCAPFNTYTVTNGYYYFLRANSSVKSQTIIAYDIAMDLFQAIQMPESKMNPDIRLELNGDSLALFVFPWVDYHADVMVPIDIWVMKETGCWNKLFNVKIPAFSQSGRFWKENELFISRFEDETRDTMELITYDLLSGKTTRKLEIEKVGKTSDFDILPVCYKESLISLNAQV